MSYLISGLTANIQLPCPERNVPAQFLMCCSPSHVAGSIFLPPTKIPKPRFTNDFRCLVPPDQGASPGLAPTFREAIDRVGPRPGQKKVTGPSALRMNRLAATFFEANCSANDDRSYGSLQERSLGGQLP